MVEVGNYIHILILLFAVLSNVLIYLLLRRKPKEFAYKVILIWCFCNFALHFLKQLFYSKRIKNWAYIIVVYLLLFICTNFSVVSLFTPMTSIEAYVSFLPHVLQRMILMQKYLLEMVNFVLFGVYALCLLLTKEKEREETEKEFIKHITFLKAMGAKVVGISEQGHSIQGTDLPIFEKKYIMNDEEWDKLCTGVNKLGKVAKDIGITLTFHHHMGTVVQTAEEIDRLMENTDPEYFNLLFDSGHLAYCGEDYMYILKKYINRIKHVHLKDIRPQMVQKVKDEHLSFLQGVRLGAFTVPGDGCIDFEPIFKVLEENGYEGYVLVEAEQDPAIANPFEYAVKARKYIAEKAGL